MKYTKTFPTFLKETGLTEEQGLELMTQSLDHIDFCETVSRRYGIELTLSDSAGIFETAPLNIES
jgi:hypothetical protein